MSLPTKDQLLAALAKTDQLAPAPRTLARVLHLLNDADSGLHIIAELINFDSALATDVLRCANSAFYSRGARVAAIDEALHVIGFHETIRIVSLVAVRQVTHRDLGSYGISADDFWAESLFSGLFLETLAHRTGAGRPDEAYTAGLLRFIGRLAIDQAVQDLGGGLFWDGNSPLADWERENVGVTQEEAGVLLLSKWQFPEGIVSAVGAQDFAVTKLPGVPELSAAMNFAALLFPPGTAEAAIESTAGDELPVPDTHPFAVAHQITSEALAELRREARQKFVAIRDNLYAR